MAKLVSPLRISGTIDDLSFCLQRNKEVIVQSKTGPSRSQVLHQGCFVNTRRNYREFRGAIQAATLLRRGVGHLWRATSSRGLSGHMNKMLREVAVSDMESAWGSRCVHKGDVQLLEGFDYNVMLDLDTALPVKVEHSLDAVTGNTRLVVPPGIVRHKRVFPKEATHFRIVSCISALHFERKQGRFQMAESDLLPLSQAMPALALENNLIGETGEVLLHTVGIVFYAVRGATVKPLRGGALRIVQVARVAAETFTLAPTDAQGKTLQGSSLQKALPERFTLEAPVKRRARRRQKKGVMPFCRDGR